MAYNLFNDPTFQQSYGWIPPSAGMYRPEMATNMTIANFDMNMAQQGFGLAEQIINGGGNLGGVDVSGLLANENTFTQFATQLANRYQQVYQPIENQWIKDTNQMFDPNYIAHQEAGAASDTGQGIDQQIQASKATLQGYGVGDPSGGKYAALDRISAVEKGAAQAGAAEQARQVTEATGRQMRQQAIAMGEQLPGMAVNYGNAANYAGASAASAEAAAMNARANALGAASRFADMSRPGYMPVGGGGGGGSGGGGGGGTMSDPFNAMGVDPGNQYIPGSGSGSDYTPGTAPNFPVGGSDQYSGDASSGSDLLAGDTSSYSAPSFDTSGSNYDTGTTSFGSDYSGGDTSMAAAGGAIPEHGGPTTGGPAPAHLSPSGGAITDDIPARLNADEFVVPRDVAKWKGEEFFHKLIDQSRKARQGVTAKPQEGPPLQGPPSFVSQGIPAGQ